jgi:hypothetical protein
MTELKLSLILLTAPFFMLYCLSEVMGDMALYRQVRDFGVSATAEVDTVEPNALLGTVGSGATITYVLHLPGRTLVKGAAHMSRLDAAAYQPGQKIEVVYASNDPRNTALSVTHAWQALISDVIAVGAYMAALALAFVLWRAAPRISAQELGELPGS